MGFRRSLVFQIANLQRDVIGPRNNEAYEKLGSEQSHTDGYFIPLMEYARSPCRLFESYVRNFVCLDEKIFQLILKQYISHIITHELTSSIYSIEDFSRVFYTMGDHEGTLPIGYDDMKIKTKLIQTRSDRTFGPLRFIEKSLLNTFSDFIPY